LAVDMIQRITIEGGIRGVHLCTLNLERSVQLVLESLHWAGGSPKIQNKLIVVSHSFLVASSILTSSFVNIRMQDPSITSENSTLIYSFRQLTPLAPQHLVSRAQCIRMEKLAAENSITLRLGMTSQMVDLVITRVLRLEIKVLGAVFWVFPYVETVSCEFVPCPMLSPTAKRSIYSVGPSENSGRLDQALPWSPSLPHSDHAFLPLSA
jgi:hypothetical protein